MGEVVEDIVGSRMGGGGSEISSICGGGAQAVWMVEEKCLLQSAFLRKQSQRIELGCR